MSKYVYYIARDEEDPRHLLSSVFLNAMHKEGKEFISPYIFEGQTYGIFRKEGDYGAPREKKKYESGRVFDLNGVLVMPFDGELLGLGPSWSQGMTHYLTEDKLVSWCGVEYFEAFAKELTDEHD